MTIRKIIYPTPLDEIVDPFNDNIDVLVELDDGNCYTTVVITPKNISQLINVGNNMYLEPGPPMVIVNKLSHETIQVALESFCDGNAYWLKEYYMSGNFDINLLDKKILDIKQENC